MIVGSCRERDGEGGEGGGGREGRRGREGEGGRGREREGDEEREERGRESNTSVMMSSLLPYLSKCSCKAFHGPSLLAWRLVCQLLNNVSHGHL